MENPTNKTATVAIKIENIIIAVISNDQVAISLLYHHSCDVFHEIDSVDSRQCRKHNQGGSCVLQ
jgi:hypothetical protein